MVPDPGARNRTQRRQGPSFTPPTEGWYVFELVVGDGQYASGPDRVLVVVGNEQPVADAARDQLWPVPGYVTLNGSKSNDADPPDELTYSQAEATQRFRIE